MRVIEKSDENLKIIFKLTIMAKYMAKCLF
jgi:hypothetical protein